jgi:putative aldouronate transport system permease protein
MLVPFLLYYILFQYLPMYGLQIAFKDYSIFKGIQESPWVGFKNFNMFFSSPYFVRTLRNTIIISLYQLAFFFPAPIVLALLFNEVRSTAFKRSVQTLTYIPHFVSIVVIAGIVTQFLSPSYGIINTIIKWFGGEPIYFLMKPRFFRPIFTGMNVWKETGFRSILYVAVISNIDLNLYEAAIIDGAGKWRQFLSVTLPGLLPTVLVMLLMEVGKMLNVNYQAIILLYQPSTYETADVISTYIYRAGIQEGQYAITAAAGLFNAVFGFVLVFFMNKFTHKLSETSLW